MYEVGDKVIYQGADKSAYKKVGVLKSIEEKNGKPQLTVEFEGGETFTAPMDDWSREFTNACSRNAKFKVGDVVSVKREAAEMIDNPALARKRGRVTKVLPGGYYEVDGELGATGLELTDAELTLANACVSTNSVVRNAIAANAKRAKNSKASEMVAKELIRLTTEARSIYNNIKRKVDEIKKAKAQVSALTLQVDSSVKKILDIAKEGELTIRALDENDPDWKEAGAAYQRFLHEMWDIKREIQ